MPETRMYQTTGLDYKPEFKPEFKPESALLNEYLDRIEAEAEHRLATLAELDRYGEHPTPEPVRISAPVVEQAAKGAGMCLLGTPAAECSISCNCTTSITHTERAPHTAKRLSVDPVALAALTEHYRQREMLATAVKNTASLEYALGDYLRHIRTKEVARIVNIRFVTPSDPIFELRYVTNLRLARYHASEMGDNWTKALS